MSVECPYSHMFRPAIRINSLLESCYALLRKYIFIVFTPTKLAIGPTPLFYV
jgi:hypothetical protein